MSLGFLRAQVLHLRKGGRALGLIVALLLVCLLLASSSLADAGVNGSPGKRAMLCGHVDLQGRPPVPSGRWTIKLTVIIRHCPQPAREYQAETNAWGDFCIPNVPVGTFDISVKAFNTLSACNMAVELKTGKNQVNFGTLLAGDANGDNVIDGKDIAILLAAYGTRRGQRRYDPRADFNDDGKVDIADANLLPATETRGCQLCP